jgi:dimethylhistidine N-methyltransferase
MLDGYQPISPVLHEVLAGLAQPQKTLPAKLFYDAEGCRLFGEITRLPEYYVTRTEQALLTAITPDLPTLPGCVLVEYGASDEAKAMQLVDQIEAGVYVPIDIAAEALAELTARLSSDRPTLAVHPIAGDFLAPIDLPATVGDRPVFGFFPGSTIGNLDPAAAVAFLSQARQTLGSRALFLVGVDLRKDPSILVPAYDDSQGVTAAFNRNLLSHLNRTAGTDFDVTAFAHRAIWNDDDSRIEMHLESLKPQTVSVGDTCVSFATGETIHTENSYKHTPEGFTAMAKLAGWCSRTIWMDDAKLFSLHLLSSSGPDK